MNELDTQVLDASNYARWNNPSMVGAAVVVVFCVVALFGYGLVLMAPQKAGWRIGCLWGSVYPCCLLGYRNHFSGGYRFGE